MSNEDVDLDIYGRTGPFGDALYFGLRDFERVLHDILERTFWPRWNLEEKRDRLLEEVKSARSEWTPGNDDLVQQAIDTWPDASTENSQRTREEKQGAIEERLLQINGYLQTIRDRLEALQNQTRTPALPSGRRTVRMAFRALLWPYFFVAYRSSSTERHPSSGRRSPEPEEAIGQKVTWLPPADYLRHEAQQLHQREDKSIARLGKALYPSLNFAITQRLGEQVEKTGEAPNDWLNLERQIESWLRVGEQPLSIRSEELEKGIPPEFEQVPASRNVGHVQELRQRDESSKHIDNLLKANGREESRFADCVYGNRSAVQFPVFAGSDAEPSVTHRVGIEGKNGPAKDGPAKDDDQTLVGVLFLCSPIRIAQVFPGLGALGQKQGEEWRQIIESAWNQSSAGTTGGRLHDQYRTLVQDLVADVQTQIQRRVRRREVRRKIEAYRGIEHSLKNAAETIDSPVAHLEYWMAKAAKPIIGDDLPPSFEGPWANTRETLERALSGGEGGFGIKPNVRIRENESLRVQADTVYVDPRCLAILTELGRNLRKHNYRGGEVDIEVGLQNPNSDTVEIAFKTQADLGDFRAIVRKIRRVKLSSWGGINFVCRYADSLAPGESTTCWRFLPLDHEPEDTHVLKPGRKQAGSGIVEAPPDFFERIEEREGRKQGRKGKEIDDIDVRMEFRAVLPNAVRL